MSAADAAVQVAIIGIVTTIITTLGVIVVAIFNNKKERGNAAESAMERTLRERIVLRDEQIADLHADVAEKEMYIQRLLAKLENQEGGGG